MWAFCSPWLAQIQWQRTHASAEINSKVLSPGFRLLPGYLVVFELERQMINIGRRAPKCLVSREFVIMPNCSCRIRVVHQRYSCSTKLLKSRKLLQLKTQFVSHQHNNKHNLNNFCRLFKHTRWIHLIFQIRKPYGKLSTTSNTRTLRIALTLNLLLKQQIGTNLSFYLYSACLRAVRTKTSRAVCPPASCSVRVCDMHVSHVTTLKLSIFARLWRI